MYRNYWDAIERTIAWMDVLDFEIENCKSCNALDFLEKDCSHFFGILTYILDNPPALFKLFNRKEHAEVKQYFDERMTKITKEFNKKRIYLHVKRIV